MVDFASGGFVSAGYRAAYRLGGLTLGVIFAAVGILFLFRPEAVVLFFNGIARARGMGESPLPAASLYLALAAAFMYLVTLLALGLYSRPDVPLYAWLVVHAKSASALVSLLLCVLAGVRLIYIANALVDGAIALAVAHVAWRGRVRRR